MAGIDPNDIHNFQQWSIDKLKWTTEKLNTIEEKIDELPCKGDEFDIPDRLLKIENNQKWYVAIWTVSAGVIGGVAVVVLEWLLHFFRR